MPLTDVSHPQHLQPRCPGPGQLGAGLRCGRRAGDEQALADLRERDIRVVMLTGDAATSARAVARELGLGEDSVVAEVLPADKARIVDEHKRRGEVVAMAGDGINDAPALATAHVGIAMGSGTDIAIESAGVTLVKGDLRGIVRALTLGRGAMRNQWTTVPVENSRGANPRRTDRRPARSTPLPSREDCTETNVGIPPTAPEGRGS